MGTEFTEAFPRGSWASSEKVEPILELPKEKRVWDLLRFLVGKMASQGRPITGTTFRMLIGTMEDSGHLLLALPTVSRLNAYFRHDRFPRKRVLDPISKVSVTIYAAILYLTGSSEFAKATDHWVLSGNFRASTFVSEDRTLLEECFNCGKQRVIEQSEKRSKRKLK